MACEPWNYLLNVFDEYSTSVHAFILSVIIFLQLWMRRGGGGGGGGWSIPCCSLVDPLSSITCWINLQSRWIFGVKNRLLRRHKINALAKTLNLPHLTAGGASRPLTELGSWFLVNWEQELGFFSSDVVYGLFSYTNTAPLFCCEVRILHGKYLKKRKKNQFHHILFLLSFALTDKAWTWMTYHHHPCLFVHTPKMLCHTFKILPALYRARNNPQDTLLLCCRENGNSVAEQ